MANTTDITITCFLGEEKTIDTLRFQHGIDLLKISDVESCGGPKVSCFETYAACHRCLGPTLIESIIQTFKIAEWDYPEFAVMLIADDDNERYDKVYTV